MSAKTNKKPLARWMSILLGGTCVTLALSASVLIADPNTGSPESLSTEMEDDSDHQKRGDESIHDRESEDDDQSESKPEDDEQDEEEQDEEEHGNKGDEDEEQDDEEHGKKGDDDDNELPNISINSTSQNNPDGPTDETVEEQPFTGVDDFTVIAVNDLGMHCGDMDTRILTILPPFNIMHAVVVQKGANGPVALDNTQVEVIYSAASNPSDPALELSPLLAPDGSVFKTNFWESVEDGAYDPLYPPALTPLDEIMVEDLSLPVPDIEELVLGTGELILDFQAMPGIEEPYEDNHPEHFELFVRDFPFFIGMPFGYVANDVNWFSAEGIPISTFDDSGRENSYPLMRVQALATKGNSLGQPDGKVLASLDTVLPVSGEANCAGCHAALEDGGNGEGNQLLVDNDIEEVAAADDPEAGSVPQVVSVEYASDLNILLLHDLKHGDLYSPSLVERAPVLCQVCHYTPALDLAQMGPLGPDDELANGREQMINKTMSRVMHTFHYSTGLFAELPPPTDPLRTEDQETSPINDFEWNTLLDSCFQCHPGERTRCLRSPMYNAGILCQDCHGNMSQVGNDFSADVSLENPGAFVLADDFYTNPDTPRVPWANEPTCQSCHSGDALSNLADEPDTIAAADGIRLLQAYRIDDPKATPILATNRRFAERQLENGNPMLYRVSTDSHAGIFCEACHGPTHGEWPVTNPAANDNVAANQLQGHSGFIMECASCHETTDSGLPLGLNGPHGMHPIADFNGPDQRWNLNHVGFGGPKNENCRACHGIELEGTVLARTATDRLVQCFNVNGSLPECAAGEQFATIPKGTEVSCGLCHSAQLKQQNQQAASVGPGGPQSER